MLLVKRAATGSPIPARFVDWQRLCGTNVGQQIRCSQNQNEMQRSHFSEKSPTAAKPNGTVGKPSRHDVAVTRVPKDGSSSTPREQRLGGPINHVPRTKPCRSPLSRHSFMS
jgi:hypothetical protein